MEQEYDALIIRKDQLQLDITEIVDSQTQEMIDLKRYRLHLKNYHDVGLFLPSMLDEHSNLHEVWEVHQSYWKEHIQPLSAANHASFRTNFAQFVAAIKARRTERIREWIKVNVAEYAGDVQVKKLQAEAERQIVEMDHTWQVCTHPKCAECYFPCLLNHGVSHWDMIHLCSTQRSIRAAACPMFASLPVTIAL
jgi:hypothetical protein